MGALAACDWDIFGSSPPVPTTVSVSPTALAFASLGDTARLAAQVRDEDGEVIPDAALTWSSGDPGVASVDAQGLVTSVANGVATVMAVAGDAQGAAQARVEQVPVRIFLQGVPDSIVAGDTLQLAAAMADALGAPVGGGEFSWATSDPVVLPLGGDGSRAVGRVPGTATVTVSSAGLEASQAVAVLPMPARRTLDAFAAATGSALWKDATNWQSDAPLDSWHGVTTDDDGEVVHIVLPDNGLIGEIPIELTSLTRLRSLHIGGNAIGGSIPPEIGRLASLQSLDLTYNVVTGPIPPEIGQLAELQQLGLFGNAVSGEIPPEIGNLGQLVSLDLCHNELTGPLPPEIGLLTNLRRLSLCGRDAAPEGSNQLTGPIPPEIGNMRSLTLLSLGANQLSGPIPPEIGQLSQLDTLLLYSNQLTSIPPEIGGLTQLRALIMYGNRLTGPIPPEIGALAELTNLQLGWGWTSGRNELTDSIPPEIGRLKRLQRLDLGGNQLTGPIPPEIGELRELLHVELGSNRLTGAIPPEIGQMTALRSFKVCNNRLAGPIPPELGRAANLRWVDLCTNQLAGPVPASLGDLTGLQVLFLAGNRLTSPLPEAMLSLRLREFYWSNNDGLCAPANERFDAWLARIQAKGGVRCPLAGLGAVPSAAAAAVPGDDAVLGDEAAAGRGGRMAVTRHVTEARPLMGGSRGGGERR